jgi:hypothetical protein
MNNMNVLVVGEISSTFTQYLELSMINFTILQSTVATRVSKTTVNNTVITDFNDEPNLCKTAIELHENNRFDVTITEFENYIYYSAIISKAIGLPSISKEAAIACTDKEVMRSCFATSKMNISPQFTTIASFQDAKLFCEKFDYPVVIKAAGLAKSLLVMICDNEEILKENCKQMFASINEVYSRIAPLKKPKVLIEEFIEGSVHSVEGYCDGKGNFLIIPNIVDCVTGRDIGVDDNYHYKLSLPTKLNDVQKKEAYKVCEEGMRTLGMTNSAAHIEFIMSPKGPRLIEIGARNGGYRSIMYKYANGLDIYSMWLQANMGTLPAYQTTKNDFCCEIDLVPVRPGKFKNISNSEKLEKLKSLRKFHINCAVGEQTGPASSGYRPSAYILLSNNEKSQLTADIDYIDKFVKAVVD